MGLVLGLGLAITGSLLVPRPALALEPLTAAQRSIFYGSAEDHLDKPVCEGTKKRVTLKCRDVRHYVRMNEWHHQVWHPYVKGLGGGYVGVASDQNLTFVAWARSEYVWLMDYDPVVVRVNRVHRALIKAAPTVDAFLKLWSPAGRKQAQQAIRQEYSSSKELKGILSAYRIYQAEIYGAMRQAMAQKKHKRSYWLHDEGDYAYVRKLHQLDRIRVMGGDLLKSTSLIGIGEAARKLGVTIRIAYTSNAEEFWPYPESFKKNFTGLPMDAKSVILRTRHSSKYGPRIGNYVYLVQGGLDMQEQLKHPRTKGLWVMMRYRKAGRPGFFTIGLPVRKESL